ncbi:MAG: cyclic nucleotide-binding domain-containing protein [Anaerolineae bacterium]|jgi:membrane protein YdbS with pleckstrin-like domain
MDLVKHLRKIDLFQRLSDENLWELASIAEDRRVEAGTHLTRQADIGAMFFIIDEGEARVDRIDEDGRQRPVGMIRAGESFGVTSLFLGEPRDATITAVTPMHLWTIKRADFSRLISRNIQFRRQLAVPPEIRERLRAPRYPWLEPGEVVVTHSRRHWIVFARSIFSGSVLFAIVLGIVLALGASFELAAASWLAMTAGSLYALYFVWHWVNWRNDYFAVTTMRLTHRERVTFIYETRHEIPLGRVQNITINRGPVGKALGYGDLTIETAAQLKLLFSRIPYPDETVNLIWDQIRRMQATQRAIQRQRMRETLAQELGMEGELGDPSPEVKGPEDAAPVVDVVPPDAPEVSPGRLAQALMWLGELDLIPQMRLERPDGTIIWRKHWVMLIRHITAPLIAATMFILMTMLSLVGFPIYLMELTPYYTPILLGLSMICLGWLWWDLTDWGNDQYILTEDRIIDIEKKPLAISEQRREASLGVIQNVSLSIPNIFANLFGYGDVLVQTAGQGDFTFDHVPNPYEVQNTIFQRMERYRENERQREIARRREEMAEWFSVYHELHSSASHKPQDPSG